MDPFNPLNPTSRAPAEPSRPAARRTYGRVRALTPEEDTVSLFTAAPAEPFKPAYDVSPAKALLHGFQQGNKSWRDSLRLLDENGAEANKAEEDEELELFMENVKKQREKRRGAPANTGSVGKEKQTQSMAAGMRSEHSGNSPSTTTRFIEPTRIVTPLAAPSAPALIGAGQLSVSFSSSQLTTLPPTSTPPSSPPKLAAEAAHPEPIAGISHEVTAPSSDTVDDDETVPIRKPGTARSTLHARRMILSDEEDESDRVGPVASSPSPSPRKLHKQKSTSPLLPTAQARSSADSDAESSASPRQVVPSSRIKRKSAKARISSTSPLASTRGTESDDDTPVRPKAATNVEAYFASLTEEDQEDEREIDEMQRGRSTDSAETIKEPAGSEEEFKGSELQSKHGKGKHLKALPAKAHLQVLKDMDSAKRELPVVFSRPVSHHLPISSFVLDATTVLQAGANSRVPALAHNLQSSPSTVQITPADDITAFTPSSNDYGQGRKGKQPLGADASVYARPGHSSPVPHRDDDDEDQDLMAIVRKSLAESDEKRKREARAAKLAEAKAAALAGRKTAPTVNFKATKNQSDDDELDLTISPAKPVRSNVPPPIRKPAEKRRGPDAKAVLNMNVAAVPAVTKNKQKFMHQAGIRSRPSAPQAEGISETYLEFASKAFKHDDLRNANGGSRPAGQKAGRDRVIKDNDLKLNLMSSHAKQAFRERNRKETDFGRGRVMPEIQEVDYEQIREMSARRPDLQFEEDEVEDDDAEDEDYVASGEEGENWEGHVAVDSEESEDDELPDSGDEADEASGEKDEQIGEDEWSHPAPQRQSVAPEDTNMDDEEEVSPIKLRRPKNSARTKRNAIESDDDEDLTTTSVNGLVSDVQPFDIPIRSSDGLKPTSDLLGFDVGGFGDDDGEGGFSQLFEATQINGASGLPDGFAGLRANNDGLFPQQALLPQNQISTTQAARDNALIAAEADLVFDAREIVETQPKKQYLNDDGFFTQTRPATQFGATDPSAARRQLGGSSEVSLLGYGERASSPEKRSSISMGPPQSTRRSTTQRRNTITDIDDEEDEEDFVPLRRLKRRTSLDDESVPDVSNQLEPTQADEDQPLPTESPGLPKNAFEQLMAARNKPPREKAAPAKSNLVDEQAEESDEDNGWGPTGGKDDDDDEEGDDGFVADLVDDQAVDEETKRQQDALAEEKRREVEKLDDSKREEQARKITEGQYRHKRRGQDFYSDESDDEHPRRLNRKQRKLKKLWAMDGLIRLDGEDASAFSKSYEEDLDSDDEDVLEEELPVAKSPEPVRSYAERQQMLQARAKANREISSDFRPGPGGGTSLKSHDFVMFGEEEEMEDSQFSITKTRRIVVSTADLNIPRNLTAIRSAHSMAAYIQEESQANRRIVGLASSTSVVRSSTVTRPQPSFHNGQRPPSRQNSVQSTRILTSKGSGFA